MKSRTVVESVPNNVIHDWSSCKQLTDVTLVSSEGDVFGANAALLAAHSDYFKKELGKHGKEDVILCFPFIPSDALAGVLHFMYYGWLETTIEVFFHVFEAAESLQLRHFPTLNNESEHPTHADDLPIASQNIPEVERHGSTDQHSLMHTTSTSVSHDGIIASSSTVNHIVPKSTTSLLQSSPRKIARSWTQCPQCGLLLSHAKALREHLVSVHPGAGVVTCPTCSEEFTGNFLLRLHLQSTHNQELCGECSEVFQLDQNCGSEEMS
ncbi:unnamed protein product [Darwinula stevensoni]|uniref:Uncharacterized protein n=1 Tax=Darwinula stevensoni TaxID=69355 RepID=A0A7R8XE94_9CRUS|nr:unnamed protein product [Darwinula stevensoni]CAG0890396.1 unnamed protein product [Darwinula stevensoni]